MTTALAHKGVVRPDAAYYGVVLDVALASYWRSYRFWRAWARGSGLTVDKVIAAQYRGEVLALCHLRRACRNARLGGAS